MLIRNVELDGRIADVRLQKGCVSEIGLGLSGEDSIDGKGGALLAGLHDHHIHLNAMAAAMNSIRCGPPEVATKDGFIKVLNTGRKNDVRGVGYHPSVAGEIDRAWLDTYGPNCPVRIQHRSGRLWIFNSLAMSKYGFKEPSNGRLYDGDTKLRKQSVFPELNPLLSRLLSYGITGVTEVTPSNGVSEFQNYIENAAPLRLTVMGKAELSSLNHPQVGPLKLHYHDHDLPSLDDLATEIEAAHNVGRNIAAHCVTRAELMLTLAAIEQACVLSGDRIEHAAIADEGIIDWMARLGVIIVTQPNFISERIAAYRRHVPEIDHQNLWRLKSFHTAGLRLAAGSDAPFGDPNPWAAMFAAVNRPKGFEGESINAEEALALYTKPAQDAGALPRRVEIGTRADVILLDRTWKHAAENLADVKVLKTWIDGELVFNRVNEAPV